VVTVIDENTGAEVEVVPVEAVAVVAAVNSLASEFPPGAAVEIERAMVWAINDCAERGITDPAEIRETMMAARQHMKASLHLRMNDLRSQAAAQEQ
jgi:hypothetical protein